MRKQAESKSTYPAVTPQTPGSPLQVFDAAVGPAEDQVFDLPSSPLHAAAGTLPMTGNSIASNDSDKAARNLRGTIPVGVSGQHKQIINLKALDDRSNDMSIGVV